MAIAGQNGNGAPRNRGDEQEQLLHVSDSNDSRDIIYISILCFKVFRDEERGSGCIDAYIMSCQEI